MCLTSHYSLQRDAQSSHNVRIERRITAVLYNSTEYANASIGPSARTGRAVCRDRERSFGSNRPPPSRATGQAQKGTTVLYTGIQYIL